MENKILWFLIFFILGLLVVWLFGAFVAWNLTWFLDTLVGRLFGVSAFLIVLGQAIHNADEM